MAFSNESEMQTMVREALGKTSRRVIANVGEGSAIVKFSSQKLVLNNAVMLEGVHFDLSYTTAREVGHKSLATALSSVAALGAVPLYASISVGLRQDQGELFLSEVFSGVVRLAKTFKIDVVGENTFPSPSSTMVAITVVAECKEKPFSPAGAKAGDVLMVTGSLGSSAAGLSFLKRLGRTEAHKQEEAVNSHLMPMPKVKESIALKRAGGVTSVVDLRDGLARDLYRLAENSSVGCIIEEQAIPIAKAAQSVASMITSNPKAWALYGGEDYELLFTTKPRRVAHIQRAMKSRKIPITVIGEVKPQVHRIKIRNSVGDLVPLMPKLWTHYARRGKLR